MGVKENLFLICQLNLFWFSFFIIGLASLIFLRNFTRLTFIKSMVEHLRSASLAVGFFVCICVGFTIMGALIVPAYIFSLDTRILSFGYIILLAICCFGLVFNLRRLMTVVKDRFTLSKPSWLLMLILGVIIAIYYYISLKTGAPLYYDSPLQISKINLFLSSNLTLGDPYFNKNGVLDLRYSTNLANAMQAIAATIFHTSAIKIWFFSGAFFKLLLGVAVFSLAATFLPRKLVNKWGVTVLIMSAALYPTFYLFASLPDRIALVWTSLLLIALKLWLERRGVALILIACFLISSTHAINALMALGFLALVFVALLLLKKASKRRLLELIAAAVVLLPPIIAQLLSPNYVKHHVEYFNAAPVSGPHLNYSQLGGLEIVTAPFSLNTQSLIIFAVVLATLASSYYLKSRLFNWFTAGVVIMGLLFVGANYFLLGVIGLVVLYRYAPGNAARLLILLCFLYYYLIAYNPVLLALAKDEVPLWLVSRFKEFNLFSFITPTIGALAMLQFSFRAISKRWSPTLTAVVAIPVLLVSLQLNQQINLNPQITHHENYSLNRIQLQELHNIYLAASELEGETVYIAPDNPLYIPNVIKANTVNVGIDKVNGSPTANNPRRNSCSQTILAHLQLTDLQAARVTIVMIDTLRADKALQDLAKSRDFLTPVSNSSSYAVYRVPYETTPVEAKGVCAIPYRQ